MRPLVELVQAAIVAQFPAWATALNTNVEIGRVDDRSTWRLGFDESVTEEQRVAARAALAALPEDLSAFQPPTLEERIATLEQENTRLRGALVQKGIVTDAEIDGVIAVVL